MNEIFRSVRMRSYLHRGVTLLFLLLIVSDLSLPQVCCKEFGCAEDAGMIVGVAGSHEDPVLLAETAPEQHEHSTGETAEKGCFCCCANFIPGHSVFTGINLIAATPIAPAPLGFSVSPPEDTFHPPRFS